MGASCCSRSGRPRSTTLGRHAPGLAAQLRPLPVFLPASLAVDPETGDTTSPTAKTGAGKLRVALLYREGEFPRQWPLHPAGGEEGVTPLLHCLRVSNDGLVYACARKAACIQVLHRRPLGPQHRPPV